MTAAALLNPKTLAERFDDWLNPIVIKELRQAVQSRFVVVMLMVLLGIQLVAVALYLLLSGVTGESYDAGQAVFMILYGILLAVGLLFVPLYTAVRLAAERSDTNVDLLYITTLRPRSIIAGKLTAAVVLIVLIFSACMPFVIFTYFLRGIDLPTIFVMLAIAFITILTGSQLAILVACFPINRIAKVFFGVVLLIVFFSVYVTLMSIGFQMMRFGVGISLDSWEFWRRTGAVLLAVGAFVGLLFALSVALVKPLAANRALPVRAYITAMWFVSGVVTAIWSAWQKIETPLFLWNIFAGLVFIVALFVAVSERDEIGPRVLREVPTSGWRRFLAFFLYSGSANGLAWCAVMCGITTLTAWIGSRYSKPRLTFELFSSFLWMGGMALYFYCYVLTAALVRRHVLTRIRQAWTWLIAIIFVSLGSSIPFLLGYLLFFNDKWWTQEYSLWMLGNPFVWDQEPYRVLFVAFGIAWAMVVTWLNSRWFVARVRGFVSTPRTKSEMSDFQSQI